jgi:hypothetical protein
MHSVQIAYCKERAKSVRLIKLFKLIIFNNFVIERNEWTNEQASITDF